MCRIYSHCHLGRIAWDRSIDWVLRCWADSVTPHSLGVAGNKAAHTFASHGCPLLLAGNLAGSTQQMCRRSRHSQLGGWGDLLHTDGAAACLAAAGKRDAAAFQCIQRVVSPLHPPLRGRRLVPLKAHQTEPGAEVLG